jgi:hypothetical protein
VRSGSEEYYATPGRFTTLAPGQWCSSDISEVVAAVQGLLVYDAVAEPLYGVELSEAQAGTINQRDVSTVLATALAVDPTPIGSARPPECRVGGRCHLFSKLTVAFLRAAGVPARARCGFGTYFRPGWYEDHWVAEYWNADAGTWVMVDAQMDATWRELVGFAGDPLNVSPDQFVTAGHAWQAWRRGDLDADRCGLSAIDEHGAFWIAGNLRLDLASLNKVEMLPWDVWGAAFEPGDEPTSELLELFDAVAELTVDPDADFSQLRRMYETDDQLRMTGEVFNVDLGRIETLADAAPSGPSSTTIR